MNVPSFFSLVSLRGHTRQVFVAVATLSLALLPLASAARGAVVNKWQVFEAEFRSARTHAHPIHDVRLEVEFTSPSGTRHRTYGFWDGTTRWKVRFCPDEIGTWTYRTACSVRRDAGLHDRTGSVVCTVPLQGAPLSRSGPIEVAPGGTHFQHEDGTPFFWLADSALPGALTASRKDWTAYATTRAAQGFTATLWRADRSSADMPAEVYRLGRPLEPVLSRLRGLDDVAQLARDAGLVSAIIPFAEVEAAEGDWLPEDEVVALMRQMIGRWDALPVTWVVWVDGQAASRKLARSRRILRHVFERIDHAPLVVFCGEGYWALEEFRADPWVDALAYQTGNLVTPEATLWLTSGPLSTAWQKEPATPLLNLRPAAEAGIGQAGTVIGSETALRVLIRSLFVTPPAGVCYRARGVEAWNVARDTNTLASVGVALPEWQKALHLPAAKRLEAVRALFEEAAFPLLEPKPNLLVAQPGAENPLDHVSVLANVNCSAVLVHVPAGQTAQLHRERLPVAVDQVRLTLSTGERAEVPVEGDSARITLRAVPESDCLFKLTQR